MKLFEFEGHKLLSKVGIESPFFVVVSNNEEVQAAQKRLKFPVVAKVQVLSGKRGKGGGVVVCKNEKELEEFCEKTFGSEFPPSSKASADTKALTDKSEGQVRGDTVSYIELAQAVEIDDEFYISITYDTVLKIPFLLFSRDGGIDIEEVKEKNPEKILRFDIDPFEGPSEKELAKMFDGDASLVDFALRIWDAFSRFDCRLVEVNPVAKVGDKYLALDAKVILDDNGLARHRDLDVLAKGSVKAKPTERELAARKIDEEDYRGSAGSTFIEFPGDIAILASGGGASLLVMDAVFGTGGKPANYTEYSGNPPAEKVEKLTAITLNREGLNGCLVAGAVANFTDIYETLRGFAQGLKQVKPKPTYPIVIRRGGPRQKEAFEMLKELGKKEGYDFHLFGGETPISVAAKKMVELAEEFKSKNAKGKSSN